MNTHALPPESVMLDAFFERDPEFDGVFVTAVQTTGIFCRPTCSARKPKRENISFFATPREALADGYRPCRRCHPMEPRGATPEWLRPLMDALDTDPTRRWTDQDLREIELSPERVRRWFKRHHGMSFHAYSRARRLGAALGAVRGGESVTRAAFGHGFDSMSGFHDAFRKYFGSSPSATAGRTRVDVDRIATPLGPMLVAATEHALCLLEFVDRRALPTQIARLERRMKASFVPSGNSITRATAEQVAEYFAGSRSSFDLPLRTAGTDFQTEVWAALRRIPAGEVRSYAELAAEIGRPKAVRAVGRANGHNAIAIVIPCHRVVGADGRLVGYGGGVWRKRRLLEIEAAFAS